ncbi:MAG: D-2-hydroxyacid dehydrogenase [Ignavibacteriae bacterium]|nr:D-2-hydroxyacid dehydrogenase [Ignavibacteriota bacterium]MCB9214845.1 D-2-hydroxyacid dehydrogenase [Ignavibacteria bacterium]
MFILSSYQLSSENNQRIADCVKKLGGRFLPTSFGESSEEIIERLDEHISEATIFLGGRLSQDQWDNAERLRWVHIPWAGVNALFSLKGIEHSSLCFTNSSGVMADSVADQVAAYLVMLNRSLAKQIRWMERREWNRYTTVEHPDRRQLRGLTVGIVGYGAIGRAVAKRSKAFGMRVIATKRNATLEPNLDYLYTSAELHKLLAESDFVVITLPLTTETDGLFDRSLFSQMKSTAFLVNIARGKIVRQDDLIEALENGTIAGAALDVVEEEPLPSDSVLWGMENVIVTPHSSGGFVGFGEGVTDLFLDNLNRFVVGDELRNRVYPGRGY